MSQAMKKVKDLLGSDAIIVSIDDQIGNVRILAQPPLDDQSLNLDSATPTSERNEPHVSLSSQFSPKDNISIPESIKSIFDSSDIIFNDPISAIRHVCDVCESHQAGYEFCEQWLKNLSGDFSIGEFGLLKALSETLRFNDSWLISSVSPERPIILVGPQGGGKTSAVAKLAAMAISLDKTIGVATLDTLKTGGSLQLEAYMSVMGVPLFVGEEKTKGLLGLKSSLYIVDTPGLNIFNPDDREILSRIRNQFKTPFTLVIPAEMNPLEISALCQAYREFDTDSLIVTRMDTVTHFGSFLAGACESGMTLALFSDSPSIGAGLNAFTPKDVLKRLEMSTSKPRGF
jgi:flagellar biosynthesis GTPase FlhF